MNDRRANDSESEREDHQRFFFALDDAEYYDATIELTVPHYRFIISTLIQILSQHFGHSSRDETGVVLDVGAGTGAEGIEILAAFPELSLLAIDLSAEMKRRFEENYVHRFGSTEDTRWAYIIEDIFSVVPQDDRIRRFLSGREHQGFTAAVSAYCIHHFPADQKFAIYKKMFDLLEPGGLLCNVDLFNFESTEISSQAHNLDIRYIEDQFDNPSPGFYQASQIPGSVRQRLKLEWVRHMNEDNLLDSVDAQLAMLRDIGFVDVECVLRYWQQGIIRATKPLNE